ncbi:hypothetical protein HWC35_gp008 [Vibrio phage USC-1]|uniref:Uncharacterized protein n=2 Tax=Aphroditevirus USC1 TaxID=2846605 RepID=A0A514A2F0_9CAUD|nr:hypothetical protein HWC35_gp008 [Vibrio phage USC-1]QCW23114.1 hypothetical protein [Vibrio phage 5 TSL-2019]QDH47402.1 hypothetical protein [Vibrio phage USC-1]
MSAILNHAVATDKVKRGNPIQLKGKFDGLGQPHQIVLSLNGKVLNEVLYTEPNGGFCFEIPTDDIKPGTVTLAYQLTENTEAGYEHQGEFKVRVTK